METTNRIPVGRAALVVAAMFVLVASIVLAAWAAIAPAAEPSPATVGLIPAACASIDPEQFPCALPSMGVRW